MKKSTLYIIIILVIGTIIFLLSNSITKNAVSSSNSSSIGEEVLILGRNHVPVGTKVTYNSNPPTSGDHWPKPAEWGFYENPLPDERLVHNLEHGGIWISYKNVDNETFVNLYKIAQKYPQAVIVTERQQNDAKIVLASWGKLLKLNMFDENLIISFITTNVNKAPEPLAVIGQELNVGTTFPDFSLTEADGEVITKDSLKGKPAIIWFTTSWCVPCQIGAREVAKLDNELGGSSFNVLVIFVDRRETDSHLRDWRKRFANKDWVVAFDNELTNLAAKVNLRFLDSKFLLDKNGVIKNIDFKIANEDYLNTIKKVVEENA